MATWNPSSIRHKAGLNLSDTEKEAIWNKLPRSQDGQIYADAVFEGGGVKGTAFLGALRCCSDVGIRWKKTAGASAGAITAALVTADFDIEELEQIIANLDFSKLLSQKTSPWIFNNDPADDLTHPGWMLGNLALVGKLGEYSSEPFKQWLQEILDKRLQTFNDIKDKERDLKVIVSDISRGQMLVLPDDLAPDAMGEDSSQKQLLQNLKIQHPKQFSVAEAVRLSMSIPFFFEPGQLADSVIVDGGILSNFPLWLYDVNPQVHKRTKIPRWPTFGFRLVEKPDPSNQKTDNPAKIDAPSQLLIAIMRSMHVARDHYHLRKNGQGRVININTTGVEVTKFQLTNDDKDYLYQEGYKSTKNFLLHEWDWQKHLESRGYELATEPNKQDNETLQSQLVSVNT
jgi:NTE family protein